MPLILCNFSEVVTFLKKNAIDYMTFMYETGASENMLMNLGFNYVLYLNDFHFTRFHKTNLTSFFHSFFF